MHKTLSGFLNSLEEDIACIALSQGCQAKAWIDGMLARRPFADDDAVFSAAAAVAETLDEADWLEAFAGHPTIGNTHILKGKSRAASEQAGLAAASDDMLREFDELNRAYYRRFGFIFIVFATGKSADEMLVLLKARIENSREEELRNAAGEQVKITQLRLRKLAGGAFDA